MTESLKDTSTAVDLVRLRRAMFAAHKESSRSGPEESDCKLLDPSPGGKVGEGLQRSEDQEFKARLSYIVGTSLDYMRPSLK